ncbi:MAG: molybdopterin-dependent oxidoreductase [Nitrospirae bacterium]|nr:molybdopterin-dependent oxidoreductase [Nitrospirota bacterium]
MIELTIDDKKVKVAGGLTILQAALENRIYIPHMCWDPRLKPYGGCRLCVVETEGQPRLLASCAYPAENGMVVHTNTPRLNKIRKTLVELLLIHHPLDCPVCDKSGACSLQDLALKFGPSMSRFSEKRHAVEKDTGSPFIERNPNRCILCGKCVRVCWEHQGVGAINFIGRGFDSKISQAFDETLDCEFCGQCVDACPVGALGNKPFKYRASAWFLESYDSICPYCGVGCTVTLDTREGKIVRTKADALQGINKGDLCVKGRYGMDFIYAENRLRKPLVRKDGQLTEVSWEEALYVLSERLTEIINTSGPARIGAIGSSKFSNENNYMMQHFMRKVVGTNNIDSISRFGYAKVQEAVVKAFGLVNLPIKLNAPVENDVILVVESDITATHPVWGLRYLEAKRKGARLLVVDPRESKLSRHSDIWLRIRPGTSVVLLNAIMNMAIEEGYHLKSNMPGDCNERTRSITAANYEEIAQLVKPYTPEMVADVTRIEEEEFIELAHAFLASENRMIAMTMGSMENNKGINTLYAAANLLMLTGDGPSALQVPASNANTYGMWQMGIAPDYLPGYTKLPGAPGKNLMQMLYDKGDGVDALYVMGSLGISPQFKTVETALRRLKLLVVQDIRFTETANLAHIVLPVCSWAEEDATFINAAGIGQRLERIVAPTGDSLPGWQIFRNLARFMKTSTGLETLPALRQQIDAIVKEGGRERWCYVPVAFDELERIDRHYPLAMVTGNLMQHSGSLSVMSRSLSEVFSEAFIQVNERDAVRFGITDGAQVRIESRRGQAIVKVKVTDEVIAGMIFAPGHFSNTRLNELTYVTETGTAPITAVNIRPA